MRQDHPGGKGPRAGVGQDGTWPQRLGSPSRSLGSNMIRPPSCYEGLDEGKGALTKGSTPKKNPLYANSSTRDKNQGRYWVRGQGGSTRWQVDRNNRRGPKDEKYSRSIFLRGGSLLPRPSALKPIPGRGPPSVLLIDAGFRPRPTAQVSKPFY